MNLALGFWALSTVIGALTVAPVGGANSLTLPAHRHLVRLQPNPSKPATYLLAVQQERAGQGGLNFYRSDDDARTFRFYAGIQGDESHFDRADLIVRGNDIALVYSYEGPQLSGSAQHDVYFQWWRYQPSSHDWTPEPAVRVFDSTSSSSAYSRGELAVDSRGRIWVMAFRKDPDNLSTAVLSLSTDNGQTFTRQPDLETVPERGGGRILAVGSKVVALYDGHAFAPGARIRMREDGWPLSQPWTASATPFTDGIYHGAALSAVEDGQGGFHLVYKDKTERLYYRHFNGTTFGPRLTVDDRADWALQPATTRIGDALVIFYNRMVTVNTRYELRARVLRNNLLSAPQTLNSVAEFKGYLNAPDVLPASTTRVPCAYGRSPDANTSGSVVLDILPWTPANDGPGQDAGTPGTDAGSPPPDAGAPDAGAPDAGRPDAGGPDAGTPSNELIFSDAFTRTNSSQLGGSWTSQAGLWLADGDEAISDFNGADQATVSAITCRDCRAEVRFLGYGVEEVGVFLRSRTSAPRDRYDAVVLSNGNLRIRRVVGGVTTVLGEVKSNIPALWEYASMSLTSTGSGPVTLSASINGVQRLTVQDTHPGPLSAAGASGLWTVYAGVHFDDYKLWSAP